MIFQPCCVLDVETGGLSKSHPTIQVAVVALDEKMHEVGSIEVKLNFNPASCDPKALELNHYDQKVWLDEAVPPGVARYRLDCFFKRHQCWSLVSKTGNRYNTARVVAHNAQFDIERVKALYGDQWINFCWWYGMDTLQLAHWYFFQQESQPDNFKLGTLCEFFGIDTTGAHDALADCRLTAELLRKLLVETK